MSVYQEILNWSQGKQEFVQDALRRLITSSALTQNDIDELVELLKKECGDTTINLTSIPLDNSHFPTNTTQTQNYSKLVRLSNPINICALHDQGGLQFSNRGLTVVYGKNGSGKSSYSRILRKLCWSRNPSIILKKNIFNPSTRQQQVEFIIENNGSNNSIIWTEAGAINPMLNSIFVFDNECAGIYINNENPTEYKPVGIDILEGLISTFRTMHQNLSNTIISYNTQKPLIPQHLLQTNIAQWYVSIEDEQRASINLKIQFTQEDKNRHKELVILTTAGNLQQNIAILNNQLARINSYIQQIAQIETLFSLNNLEEIKAIRDDFVSINESYQIATTDLDNINTLEGFGDTPWRTLWESAKNYVKSYNLTDEQNFTSLGSLEKCVLCQQVLDEASQHRLMMFDQFILNDISTQLNDINIKVNHKIYLFNSIVVPHVETLNELGQLIPNFGNTYNQFAASVDLHKNLIIKFLNDGGELNTNFQNLTPIIADLIPKIELQLGEFNQSQQDRNVFVDELNELNAREYLFIHKAQILKYFDEYNIKMLVTLYQSKLATNGISQKIGELMENQSVNLQHQEFVAHLNFFNQDLSTKVQISRTRTRQGNTFQKCSLNVNNDAINTIFSEGEQKIIALSNFLAECTIDGRLNTIIFDDPVTSLDMDYRDLIVEKIILLSINRQIIVFTHDLSFMRLLLDTHRIKTQTECTIIGIDKFNGISGIVTDEIPYLAKNVQERVDSIRRILNEHDAVSLIDAHGREVKLDSARKRFRMLIERTVEEVISSKTYERFSKNITLKKNNLSSYIVTDKPDIDFLLSLYGKYSTAEHDGGITTIHQLPTKAEIMQDISNFSSWKEQFLEKKKDFQNLNSYR